MFQRFFPTDLQSLFHAFTLLENGTSILLSSPELKTKDPSLDSLLLTTHQSPLTSSSPPSLGLYSSGSTGTPKLSWRPWAQLKSELRLHSARHGWTWASPFAPCTFAGVQVALQAWAEGGQIFSLTSEWSKNMALLAKRNVRALSCTPTFLDLLLQHDSSPQAWTPLQITLGGEPLRPAAGKRFESAFPNTRFTVIYASAEYGVLLKTQRLDGWYELASLEKRFPRWRIQANELQIWCNDGWQSTCDLVDLDGALIRVLGRADAVANIAGSKVSLDEVIRIAEQVPGVCTALAYAEPSSISGQIVALRFTPETGFLGPEVQGRLETHLRQHLRKEAWPRRWEIGPIDLGPNAKRPITSRE